MIDWIVKLYRKMNTTARRAAVLLLAFVIAMSTLHVMTFPATALTRQSGESDPGIVIGDETNTEGFDNASEGGNTDVNPVNTEAAPTEEPAVITGGETPAPADTTVNAEPTPEPTEPTTVTENAEPTATPDGNEETAVIVEPTATPEVTPTPEPTETPAVEEEPEEVSDPSADVETDADWENLFRDVELSGVWADDLLTVAELQKGYKESGKNFVKDDEGKKYGYTRYGEWYGEPYAEWDSLFVMFNLYYAGITKLDFPYQADCEEWIDALKDAEMFHEVNTYVPSKGDLVFADVDEDDDTDHVAIVKAVEKDEAGNPDKLIVIEGDIDNEVKESTYEFYNPLITGFAQLPENPEMVKEAEAVEEAIAEEPKAEPVYATFEGKANNVVVTVQYEEGAFPEGTTMKVKPVWNPSVLGAINDTVTDKEVVKVQAVDIQFLKDGKEIEPSRPIKVTMKSTSIPKQAEETPTVVHVDDKLNTEVVEAEQAEEAKKPTEAVTFESGAFSVYAIVYTVDFAYSLDGRVFAFSMEGGTSMKLSALVEALGIIEETSLENGKAFAAEVQNVEFTDSTLLKVKKDFFGNDWTLTSLAPFTSQEALTITMNNGNVFTIDVTDAQGDGVSTNMRDAVKSATMNGQTGNDWTVRSDEEYTVHLEFVEVPGSIQFPTTSNDLVYQLPSTFNPHSAVTGTPVPLTYMEKSVVHTLTGCTYDVGTDGKVTIHLTDEAKDKLAASGDGTFRLDVNGFFTANADKADFGGGNVKNITVNDTKDVAINKAAEYKSDDNKVHYTVTVKATGDLTNVKVTDTISGTALTMDQDSITINGNSSEPTDTSGATSDGFNYTFPTMKNGETITITYTASVNWNEIGEGKGTVEQTGNTVKVKPNETDEKIKETNLENRISYNPLGKRGGEAQDTENPNIKIVPWTITVNSQGLKNMKNTTITDHNDSPSVMKYSGDGITVEKIHMNEDGTSTSTTSIVSWSSLGIDHPETATAWSYTITDDGNDKYVITYLTKVDVTGQNGNIQVNNHVDDGKGDSAHSHETVPPGTAKIDVDKQIVGTPTAEEMSWKVDMFVPASGLSKAIMTDTLPTADINGVKYRDTLKPDSIHVEGLEAGENYVIKENTGRFTITFYKDTECTQPGLLKSESDRKITVTFKTLNDEGWIAAYRTGEHTNNVKFEGDNAAVYDQDSGRIPQRGIDKTEHGTRTITMDGAEVLAFEYTIDLYGVTDGDFTNDVLTVTDDYNQTYLKFLELRGYNHKYGIDTYFVQILQNGYNGGDIADRSKKENDPAQITPSVDEENGILNFNINKSQFPKNSDGSYYERYQLRYYLVVKDAATQALLLKDSLAAENRTITLNNTATWGTSVDNAEVDYSYPGLVKDNVMPSTRSDPYSTFDPETGLTGFKVVINPDKLTLNGGQDMTLTDEYSGNLSVVYSSIKFTVEPDDRTISYDYRGNVGTFIIPDNHKVIIEYDAKVVGTPNSWVQYGNTVKMSGFEDSADGNAHIGGSGDGGFNLYSITLYKYDAGHMETGLDGAEFTMVDENGEPIVYPAHATNGHAGEPITFETKTVEGKHGYVDISLNEQEDGISLQKGITYYLKETKSPASHAKNNTIYRFTISDNPNYSNYEYHSGDILKVYDWPVLGKIDITKSFVGVSNLTEEEMKKITFEVTGTYKEGSRAGQPILLDSWGYAIPAEDLSKYDLSECTEFKVEMTYAEFSEGKYSLEDLVDGNYVVKETNAALGGFNSVTTTYNVDSQGVAEGAEANVTITSKDSHTVAFENTYTREEPIPVDITIKKVYKNGTTSLALYGAKFKLEKKNTTTNEYEIVTDGSVASDGTFTIPYSNKDTGVTLNSLWAGEYRITEVEAPTNYKIIGDGIFEFTINDDKTITQTKGSDFVEYTTEGNTFTVNNQEKHSYTITKVDGANVSLKLPGAEFGVYIHTTVDEDKTADKSNPLKVYTTDEKGRFEINVEDYAWDTTGTTTYYIQEIKAPEGYSLPNDPGRNYFYFGARPADVAQTGAANLRDGSRSQTITNDLVELEVIKRWRTLENQPLNQDDITEIDFKVFQTATVIDSDTGEKISETETQYPNADKIYTLEKEGDWNPMKIEQVPAVGRDKDGNLIRYTYRLEEVIPDGYEVIYTSENDGRRLVMTNRPESTHYEARKEWSENTPEDKKNFSIKFKLQRKLKTDDDENWTDVNNSTKNVTTWNGSKFVPVNEEWKVTWEALSIEYDYRAVEVIEDAATAKKFDISYSTDPDGVEVVTNTYNRTFVEAKKVWKDAESGHGWVEFELYRFVDGAEPELVKKSSLSPDDKSFTLRFDELDKVDEEGNTWKYYVVEKSQTGYTTTYSVEPGVEAGGVESGTIVVTNTKNSEDKLAVKKLWQDSEGNPVTPPANVNSITVQLMKSTGEPSDKNITLSSKALIYAWDGSQTGEAVADPIAVKENSDVIIGLNSEPNDFEAGGQLFEGISVNGASIEPLGIQDGKYLYKISVGVAPVEIVTRKQYNYNSVSVVSSETDYEYGEQVPVGDPVTLNDDNLWAHKWNVNAAENEKYYIKEISSVAGYITTYENNGGIKTGIIYVKNIKSTAFDLDILKVDKNNSEIKLPGATFSLQKVSKDNASNIGDPETQVTDVSGEATFTNLTSGYYKLTETEAPENYIKVGKDYIYLYVSDAGIQLADWNGKSWTHKGAGTDGYFTFTLKSDDANAKATVANDNGVELPRTGGSGTGMITILGSILILTGAGVLLLRRRRESL